jgi:hypothetical protein
MIIRFPRYLLRLVKPKRILVPFSLSFLLTFSMKVLRSVKGFLVLSANVVSLNKFQIQDNIIAYL